MILKENGKEFSFRGVIKIKIRYVIIETSVPS